MQHPFVQTPNSHKPIEIEVDGQPLGVLIPDPKGFRFLAVRFSAFPIDGQVFASIDAARAAAVETLMATP